MHLSELQNKEIINMSTGKRLGLIVDVILERNGNIRSLIIEEKRGRKFTGREEFEIGWDQITKIGDDIILVKDKYQVEKWK